MSFASTINAPSLGTAPHASTPAYRMDRRLLIVITVIGCHVLALWALQTGLLRRAIELVVPVQVLAEMIEAPRPLVEPAPAPPQPPQTTRSPVPQRPIESRPVTTVAPQPLAIEAPATVSETPATPSEPQALVPAVPAAPLSHQDAAVTAAPPASNTPPSTNIDHRFRPQPPYPQLSVRMGERGVVTLRVMVSKDGLPTSVQISQSSGHFRLDNAAVQTVKDLWRFTPGTRAGVPVDMEALVSIRFSIDL
jgi:protein TonB